MSEKSLEQERVSKMRRGLGRRLSVWEAEYERVVLQSEREKIESEDVRIRTKETTKCAISFYGILSGGKVNGIRAPV